MNYEDIIPTHNSLRNPDSFYTFIKNPDLILNADKPPLLIRTEDEKLYINDGHHRLTAAVCLGIDFSELTFDIAHYSYEDMLTTNFDVWWVTPYDPRIHVRTNNCLVFKNKVKEIAARSGKTAAFWYIKHNRSKYIEVRKVNSLKELIPNESHSTK